jgi:hypothetical protein
MPVVDKSIPLPVETVQSPCICPNPELPLAVFQETRDIIVRNRRGVFGVMPINQKGVSIEFVEAVLRAEPEKPVPVLQDRIHGRLRQSLVHGILAKGKFLGVCLREGQEKEEEKAMQE